MKCKNCDIDISPVEKEALRKKINELRESLAVLEIRQKCQEQGFCDSFCEQRYHGDL